MYKIEDLKKISIELNEIVSVIDKIASGFENTETTALVLLLFFKEQKILDKLAYMRKIAYNSLSENLSKEEFDRWLEQNHIFWKPPYNKNNMELINMIKE